MVAGCRHETEESTSSLRQKVWPEFQSVMHCLGLDKKTQGDSSPTAEWGMVFCEAGSVLLLVGDN